MLVVEWKLNLCQLYLLRSWAWSLSTDLARFSFPQRNFYSEERRRMNERCSERPDSGLLVVSAQHAAAVLNHHFLVETTASLSLLHWASHCLSPPHSMMLISVSFSLTSLSGYWSTSCRLSGGLMIMRWSRCAASCRTSRRRTTGSSSS